MTSEMKRRRQKIGTVAAVLLILLALGSGVVSAQDDAGPEAAVTLDLTVTEITDPGSLWIDDSGLHIRGLAGTDAVSGDLTGAADTLTNIDWAAPCNPETLVCLGAQISFTQLTITDEAGSWAGNLQLVIDPANAADTAAAVLIGQGGNAGHALYLNEVISRTDTSLSLSGQLLTVSGAQAGVNLTSTACLAADGGLAGSFVSSSPLADAGGVGGSLTMAGLQAASGVSGQVVFESDAGSFMTAFTEVGQDGLSWGQFVLMGTSGAYEGMVGFGRTGSTVYASGDCASGSAVRTFWIGTAH